MAIQTLLLKSDNYLLLRYILFSSYTLPCLHCNCVSGICLGNQPREAFAEGMYRTVDKPELRSGEEQAPYADIGTTK